MGIVWVTGISGAGKSSVCEGLRQRGHRAVDADGDGYSRWVDRRSGQLVADPPDPTPAGWLDRYAWRMDVERVRALATDGTATVTRFLCGSVENEHDVWPCFDRVVCLVADDETIRHRLATRTTNAFGNTLRSWRRPSGGTRSWRAATRRREPRSSTPPGHSPTWSTTSSPPLARHRTDSCSDAGRHGTVSDDGRFVAYRTLASPLTWVGGPTLHDGVRQAGHRLKGERWGLVIVIAG